MKKISTIIMSAMTATAMIPTSGISANAQETDYSLWEKFLKYDLCITDYSSLTNEEKELCKFIFETEQSADETLRCERARRMLAHDENIGNRITIDALIDQYGVWDNYSDIKFGNQWYIHCVPDLRHLDGFGAYDEYWLDDDGDVKLLYIGGDSSYQYNTPVFTIKATSVSDTAVYEELCESYGISDMTAEEQFDGTYAVSFGIKRKAPKPSLTYTEADGVGKYESDDFIEVDGDFYYTKSDNTAIFVKSKYSTRLLNEEAEPITEPVIIAEEVNGCPVTAIERNAFINAPVTEVILPETIEFIDESAFECCEHLEKINFPKGLKFIGMNAFAGCNFKKINIYCPALYISPLAFRYSNAESVYVNAKEICDRSFDGLINLKTLTFGNDVEKIDEKAFYSCNIENVKLPASLKTISQGAFAGAKSVTIPPAVEVIGALPTARGEEPTSGIYIPATHPLTDDPVCVFDSDCVISGYRGTEAERYAKEWNLTFIELEAEKGDVNLDGEITVADAVTLQNYLFGRYVKTGTAYGDMDDDGRINAFDMIMIRKKLVENQ